MIAKRCAIACITARPRPLALYAFGLAGADLQAVVRRTHAGGMAINDGGWQAFNHDLPFGGIGNSGMGSHHGEEGFRALSHAKPVDVRHRFFPIGHFYSPYGNAVQRQVMRFYLGTPEHAAGRTRPGKKGKPATTAGSLRRTAASRPCRPQSRGIVARRLNP